MASWGPKLYQDDIAEDVRDYYKDQLKRGKTNEQVTGELIEEYDDILSDEEETPVFWFALADTQWEYGRLLPYVKEKALEYLKSGTDLIRWKNEAVNLKEYQIREKVLIDLEFKLKSPQPLPKKVSQYRLYQCEWKIGDTFAYQLESDYAKENGLYKRYLILRKVDETIWWPGHVIPILYAQITEDEKIPQTQDEISKLKYIQTANWEGKYTY